MKNFIEVKNKVINELINSKQEHGDLDDIGNLIGIAIGKFISNDLGFEKKDFIAGLEHGISLIDGTHD